MALALPADRTRSGPGPAARRRRRLARRWLTAGLVAGAGAVAVGALAPPRPATRLVLVADRDLPAGAVLAPGDVREVRWAAETVPVGVLGGDDLPGPVLATPMRRGELLTRTRTRGADLLAGQPAGTLAATVDVGDTAVLASLAPGAHVDVLARTEDPVTGRAAGAERVATDVVVLSVPAAGATAGLLAGPGAGPATSVLVAVDAPAAARLAASAGRTVVALHAR
ncbi:SAF domain-containing protein [Kineococcus sp. SYSU DK006]|uniref:SAF domain-containing protein n=1 Tax=Kineococcus sp. SYSU DK006 TaxID=3383127 RepID=UPI003D7F1244